MQGPSRFSLGNDLHTHTACCNFLEQVNDAMRSGEAGAARKRDDDSLQAEYRQWERQRDAAHPDGADSGCRLPASEWEERFRWRGMLTEATAARVEQSMQDTSAKGPPVLPR